mmetsp:Transcript_5230/g.3000  ORF Transcript_5230/g.3000 Transcript_5230/m.3000 type:complete len:96 (+) Transcript_5230:329-616(+)
MERSELLAINGKIFKGQGEAISEVCNENTRFLVVANPANTNCLILSHHAPNLPKKNFTSMTRLDHNRAMAQIALKKGTPAANVKNVAVWGNHSVT